MRMNLLAAVLFATLTTCNPAVYNVLSALAPYTPNSIHPTPGSAPPCDKEGLELRQAPAVALNAEPAPAPAAPAIPLAALPIDQPPLVESVAGPVPAPPAVVPPAIQAVPPVAPAAIPAPLPPTITSMTLPPLVTGDDFLTVQWVETHIGTLRTWVAKTQTFHFEAMSQAPLPGVGSIGMGTLKGKTGQTQTI